jgi:16S rRNA (cytosine967-C5)-methyltransferase
MSPAPKDRYLPRDPASNELRGYLLRLYAEAVQSPWPADHVAGFFFRKNASLAGRGKGFVAATLFALLRKRIRLVLLALAGKSGVRSVAGPIDWNAFPPEQEAQRALVRWLVEDMQATPADAVDLLTEACRSAGVARPFPGVEDFARFVKQRGWRDRLTGSLREGAELSLHPDLVERWRRRFGADSVAALADALQEPAPLQLRINTHLTSREVVLRQLRADGVEAAPTSMSPQGIELAEKLNLKKVRGLDESSWEVQDEGSQLVALALDPPTKGTVLDACAGGGGKSLHLASIRPDCSIEAWDVDPARMEPMVERQERARLRNIKRLESPPSLPQQWDAVLVDAPCMGLGRLRRDPAIQWRGGTINERISAMAETQLDCLSTYALLVRPGGVLVYALCSFEQEETEGVLKTFESRFPEFKRERLPALFQGDAFSPLRSGDGSWVILLPPIHRTDGFFIARYRRAGN